MSKDASFDVVSEFDMQEMVNAVDQVSRDLNTRFDLKDTGSEIELDKSGNEITLTTTDEMRLQNIITILEEKLIKRQLSVHILEPKTVESALGGKVRQVLKLKNGLETETAKKIVAEIKGSKVKVQASIQGDQVRVTGKSRDDLQAIIALLKEYGQKNSLPLQFTNYR